MKTFAYVTPKYRVCIKMPDYVWDVFIKIVDTKSLKITVDDLEKERKNTKHKKQSVVVFDEFKTNPS